MWEIGLWKRLAEQYKDLMMYEGPVKLTKHFALPK